VIFCNLAFDFLISWLDIGLSLFLFWFVILTSLYLVPLQKTTTTTTTTSYIPQAPLSLCFVLFFPSCLLAYCVANPIAQKNIETHKTKANKQTMNG
jgi:hypothetical protein